MQKIIDFHVHPFASPEFCLNFYPEMDPSAMQRHLRSAGITRICGSVLKKGQIIGDFSDLQLLNRSAAALKEELGDFYIPGFHVHPGFVQESCTEIERMKRLGFTLIGELVPYMHGWGRFSERNWMEILDAAAGMVVSYHTPFDYPMESVIRTHPDILFVAAHPGDHDRVPEHIALMKQYENVYLDLSGTGLFRFGLLKHLVTEVGSERILFGTDYPICNPRMYVQAVMGEDISDTAKENIFCKNAERILF